MQRRIWIIGGSSGIGLCLVKEWLRKGYSVAVSARSASENEELAKLKSRYGKKLLCVDLDVTDTDSIKQAAQSIWDEFKELDWCMYNAGAYEVMKLDEWDIAHFEKMNETNYLGAIRFCNIVVPKLRQQGFGRIIFNASLSAYFGLPYGGGYSAPKAAVFNFAQSLQPELLEEGIQTQVINHGFVKTRLTSKNNFDMPQLMSPEKAAEGIAGGLEKEYRFEIHFPFALRWFLRFLSLIPNTLALKITRKLLQ